MKKWDKIMSWFSFDERQESTSKSGYVSCTFVDIIKRRTRLDSAAWAVFDYGRNPSGRAAGRNGQSSADGEHSLGFRNPC